MTKDNYDIHIDELLKAIVSLKNKKECKNFLEDILTVNEINSIAQRLMVAKFLNEGRTYKDIEDKTGASSATISRVKKFLEYGSNGYQSILKKDRI